MPALSFKSGAGHRVSLCFSLLLSHFCSVSVGVSCQRFYFFLFFFFLSFLHLVLDSTSFNCVCICVSFDTCLDSLILSPLHTLSPLQFFTLFPLCTYFPCSLSLSSALCPCCQTVDPGGYRHQQTDQSRHCPAWSCPVWQDRGSETPAGRKWNFTGNFPALTPGLEFT